MTTIIPFMPTHDIDADENIAAFVCASKTIISGLPSIQSWESNTWNLGDIITWKGRGRGKISAVFSNYDTTESSQKEYIKQPFLEFAKAYFIYQCTLKPQKNISIRLGALRSIEHAMLNSFDVADPTRITPEILNLADSLNKLKFSNSISYHIGLALGELAKFVSKMKMVRKPFLWKTSIPHPKSTLDRVGPEGDAAREKKLPSPKALETLPKCFILATEIPDVVISSIAALLCTAPDRISEIFALRRDCEIERSEDGNMLYGLRYYPSKGAPPMVKWIAPTMIDVAKQAIEKLKTACAPAREISSWYEANPGKLFIEPEFEYLREKELLSLDDVSNIIGLKKRGSARGWLKTNKITIIPNHDNKHIYYVKYSELESKIISMLSRNFPILDPETDLLYSQALIVLRYNEMKFAKDIVNCLVEPLGTTKFNIGLGAGSKRGRSSLFSRLNFTEDDGSSIEMNSHQFRHWLNTLAHKGGMSQLDIAKWSGRKDTQHNNSYDHMTGNELMSLTQSFRIDSSQLYGSFGELVTKSPVSRDEFLELEFPTAHVTEIGFCVHDYSMLPCEANRDCINCSEHIYVKGNHIQHANIKNKLELAKLLFSRASEARDNKTYGADRWYEKHKCCVERMQCIYDFFEDPQVPDGAIFRLAPVYEQSRIRMAIQDNESSLRKPFQRFKPPEGVDVAMAIQVSPGMLRGPERHLWAS